MYTFPNLVELCILYPDVIPFHNPNNLGCEWRSIMIELNKIHGDGMMLDTLGNIIVMDKIDIKSHTIIFKYNLGYTWENSTPLSTDNN